MANAKDSTKINNDQVQATFIVGAFMELLFPGFINPDTPVPDRRASIAIVVLIRLIFAGFAATGAVMLLQLNASDLWLPTIVLALTSLISLIKVIVTIMRLPNV